MNELEILQLIKAAHKQKDDFTVARLINKLISDSLPSMDLEAIKAETLSTGITTANCVYEAKEDAVMIVDPDGKPETINDMLVDLPKGSKLCIAGCGDQSEKGMSYYMHGDDWVLISNDSMKHVANPILQVAPKTDPVI